MSKSSTIEIVLTESYRLVEGNRNFLWEWICEMQSEIVVADAVSSRYRGKISCVSDEEVIELVADISDLGYPFFCYIGELHCNPLCDSPWGKRRLCPKKLVL